MHRISYSFFRRTLTVLALLLTATSSALAAERSVDFLRALQRMQYGEAGVAYLEQLSAENRLPRELKENYDLEMSICVRDSVQEAFNKTEAKKREEEYKRFAKKFIDEHPNSTEVARAREILGGSAFDNALRLIAESKFNKDKAAAAKQLEEARKALQEARPGLEKSAQGYKSRYEKLRDAPAKKGLTAREKAANEKSVLEAKLDWMEADMKAVMSVYYLAQTYADPKSGPRIEALKNAGKLFDAIYQDNRTEVNVFGVVGRFAHLYDGKCAEEMGKEDLAQDIYDEVRAGEDPNAKEASGQEKLMAQAANFSMLITLHKKGLDTYMDEAVEWLRLWDLPASGAGDNGAKKAYRKTDGYQAVSLQYVKGLIQKADKANGAEKGKLLDQARKRLREMIKTPSDSLAEAMHLNKQLKSGEGGEGESVDLASIKDLGAALTQANAAVKETDWELSLKLYSRALEFVDKMKDKEKEKEKQKISEAKEGLAQAQLNVAFARYRDNRLDEAYKLASESAQSSDSSSVLAPKAAALCVQILTNQYDAIKDNDKQKEKEEKDAVLARLTKVAAFTFKNWGDRPEADDVRIAMGRLAYQRSQVDEAIKYFEEVNPRSEKFGTVQQLAGQLHYYRYVQEKNKPEDQRDMKMADAERDKAEKQLAAALEEQRKTAAQGQALPDGLIEVQLLLADLRYNKGDYRSAAQLLQQLVDNYKAHKPQNLGKEVLKTFYLAVRSYNAAGDFAKGGAVAETLVDFGDSPEINGISVDFVRTLAEEFKIAELAAGDAKTGGDANKIEAAEAKAFSLKGNLNKLLDKMVSKENHTLKSFIYMGDTAARVGNTAVAETFYKRALDKVEKDPASAEGDVAKAVTRVRAQLVGLMQQRGQFEAGLKEIDKLIESQPKALEPKVVRARLMQGWAEQLLKEKKDPTNAKLKAAIGEWASLRNMLQRLPKKPADYYEANYYAAYDCWLEYENSNPHNVEKANDARKVLRTVMVQSPSLSGPEMVARYNQLLARIAKEIGEPVAPAATAAKAEAKG
jgi:hypothetical protein